MSEAPAPSRRRDRGRSQRSSGPSLAPLPRLKVPWAPIEVLTPEQVERIVQAAYRILEEAGLEIRSAAAREVFHRAGASVDESTQMVRLGRELIEAQLAHAPPRFVLHARNPERHLHVGDNVVNFGPVTGAPHIRDLERGRRYGDLEAFHNILKLTHRLGVLPWQGGIVARCHLLRPGAPCVLGGFTSNVDMRTGSPAFGTPEYLHAVFASAQIGRCLRIPVRTSAVNASPTVDAQSTYESAFSLQAAVLSHSHLINHAAGWLEGGLSASLEKIVVDAELLRNWAEILKPVSFSDDDLAVDAIKEVAAGGHFFGSPHTLARYETAFYRPLLSDWSSFESWTQAGAHDATARATAIWKKVLADYVPPPLDPAVSEAIAAYVATRKGELEGTSPA